MKPQHLFFFCLLFATTAVISAPLRAADSSATSDGVKLPEFGAIPAKAVIASDDLFAVIWDKYPVSPGHALIIARRPAARFQELAEAEKTRLLHWIDWTQKYLSQTLERKPDGFNFGLNDGAVAGQTKAQLHFHIIPRYAGDVADPRGGVRYVIPAKANYWDHKPDDSAKR